MYDVAIVGAGPVGAVAANLCGVYGLSAVAFDREADVYDLPRAAGMYDDVQRILHNAGVLDAILPATCEMVGAEFLDASGKRIIGFEVPPGMRTANGYHPLLNIDQPPLERAIRSCLAQHERRRAAGGARGARLRADRRQRRARRPRCGERRDAARAGPMAASAATAPTASSASPAASAGHSLGYDCDWLVIDLELTRDVELPRLCQQRCDPERPTTIIPLPGRLRRWEFQLKPGETRAEMEDRERVWRLLAPWLSPR